MFEREPDQSQSQPPPVLPTTPLCDVATEAELLAALGEAPPMGRGLLLVGGAGFADPEQLEALQGFFGTLAWHCQETGTAVIDGGTDSGVMRLIAEARAAIGGDFMLVGIAPTGAFERPTRTGQDIEPAPGHSLVVLVPGSAFGDETEWLFHAADHFAGGAAPTLVVNGGELSMREAVLRLSRGCVVVAVEGSGRAADELAADEGLRASGRLRVIPLASDVAAIAGALEDWPER